MFCLNYRAYKTTRLHSSPAVCRHISHLFIVGGLFLMVHELLVNVLKHAEASYALVIVRWGVKKMQIVVEDDGKGFLVSKTKKSNSSGMGLFSIRERLRSVGGEMKIVSTPNKGTTISLVAPITHNPI